MIPCARNSRHSGAGPGGDLNGVAADASARAIEQDFLFGADPEQLLDDQNGGKPGDR